MSAQSSGWILAFSPSLTPPISAGPASSTPREVQAVPSPPRLAGRQRIKGAGSAPFRFVRSRLTALMERSVGCAGKSKAPPESHEEAAQSRLCVEWLFSSLYELRTLTKHIGTILR